MTKPKQEKTPTDRTVLALARATAELSRIADALEKLAQCTFIIQTYSGRPSARAIRTSDIGD